MILLPISGTLTIHCTKNKFSIKDFFSKCDQILRKLRIWSHFTEEILHGKLHFLCNDWKGKLFFYQKNVLKGLLLDSYIQIQKDSMNTMTVNLELMLLWIYIKRKPSKFHIIIYGANIINEVLLSGNALHWLYQKKLAMACFLFHRNIEIDLPKMLQDQFPLGCQLTV